MKPKNLKSPRTWKDRCVLIEDRVWYIPKFYDAFAEFIFPGWDAPELFGNTNPVMIEYCSGNGAWIAAKAQAYPQFNWVAVEKKFERVKKIWSKLKNLELNNLIIISGEGLSTTSHYFPDKSVSEIFINFPDPWPKRCHAKHRIISPVFVEQMNRTLTDSGKATLVTDDEDYSTIMIHCMLDHPNFESIYPEPHFTNEHQSYGTSYFDQLWREMGKKIRYHQFKKKTLC